MIFISQNLVYLTQTLNLDLHLWLCCTVFLSITKYFSFVDFCLQCFLYLRNYRRWTYFLRQKRVDGPFYVLIFGIFVYSLLSQVNGISIIWIYEYIPTAKQVISDMLSQLQVWLFLIVPAPSPPANIIIDINKLYWYFQFIVGTFNQNLDRC